MGQGSPDPVRPYHAHWATCVVGEAAPAYFLAGEAIEPGVTVVWGLINSRAFSDGYHVSFSDG